MYELSILIPARNEMFLKETIEDILKNIRGNTEIIVVCDGDWPVNGIDDNSRLTIVKTGVSIGQRAATNMAAKLSKAKYVMKLDAHCAFDEGFDVKLLEGFKECGDDVTFAPVMKNLHAFDWVCGKCSKNWYQGPTPIKCQDSNCDSQGFYRNMLWKGKPSPNSTAFRFNRDLEFKYWGEYKEKQAGDYVETLSLQGSCFMLTRENYWALDICDESWGSWGGQGAEVALKTWLSGGRVLINKKTWYAHLFRTQGGDFGFPYPNPGKEQKKAKDTLRATFLNDAWPKAKYKLEWLIDRFSPVPEWDQPRPKSDELTKGILFYTDNAQDNTTIGIATRSLLLKAELPIVSVSLKPLNFGNNIVLDLEPGYLTMAKQILAGLESIAVDIVFFAEHDVLYHPSHFNFTPDKKDIYYYNQNIWEVRSEDGHALFKEVQKLSQLCAYRATLIEHFKKRVELLTAQENTDTFKKYVRRMGFEPGTNSRAERVDDLKSESFFSPFPNIDVRHDKNLTPNRWRKEQFKDQRFTRGWTESESVPGWGITKNRFSEVLNGLR